MTSLHRSALVVAFLLVAAAGQVQGQSAARRVYFLGQAGRGSDWFAGGAQVDVVLTPRVRIAPDLLIAEGGGLGSLSLLYGSWSAGTQRVALYGGAGGGFITADDVVEGTLMLRVGVEIPLTSERFALRVEGREYFVTDGNESFFLVVALRVP